MNTQYTCSIGVKTYTSSLNEYVSRAKYDYFASKTADRYNHAIKWKYFKFLRMHEAGGKLMQHHKTLYLKVHLFEINLYAFSY